MKPALIARAALAITALLFMQLGPLLRTGFNQNIPPFLHAWRMYHNRGWDQCKMETFFLEKGAKREVDWIAELGMTWADAPRRLREVTSVDEGMAIARQLCRETPEGVGVSAVVTCGDRRKHAWRAPTETADVNVCIVRERKKGI